MGESVEITATLIKTLLADPPRNKGERRDTWDSKQPGLVLRQTPTAASWYVIKRAGRRVVASRMADATHWTVTEARRSAVKLLAALARGENPNETRRADALRKTTLAELFEHYRESHGKRLKDSTLADYQRSLNEGFADWMTKPVVDLTREVILKRHKELMDKGATSCNVRFRVLRLLLNHGVATLRIGDSPLLSSNPVDVLRQARLWAPPKRKSRVIPADRLGDWLRAVRGLRNPQGARALEVLMLTGWRRSELTGLCFADLRLDEGTPHVIFTDPKNRHPASMPLVKRAVELLRQQIDFAKGLGSDTWLWPKLETPAEPAHYLESYVDTVVRVTGLEFSCHDMRRTFATACEASGLPLLTTKRLLGHIIDRSEGATGGYIRLALPDLQAAAERVVGLMLARAEGGQVIAFPKKASA
ncbi:putative Integrase family protein [Gammaproteobacteria bacterium]